jgi:5-methylcytosine-specific restriction endonuclease McrA
MTISKEQYLDLINRPCTYCSSSVLGETGSGLDRLDNNGGYDISNVVTCCGVCNQIKNVHLTHDEMKVAMNAILDFRAKKSESKNQHRGA